MTTGVSSVDMTTENTGPAEATPEAILQAVRRQLAGSRLPDVTYRLQFHRGFTFRQAAEIVPYLAELGVTHVYASPYLKANPGSMHGYDITDHSQLNPEVGTPEEYDRYVEALHRQGMGQILDVVPNHMSVAGNDNAWWMDVLENGPSSIYAHFFDIDWMPLKPDLANKVLLPVLGDQFGRVLEDQQLVLTFEEGAFFINYYDRRFPIGPRSSGRIVGYRIDELERRLGPEDPHLLEYQSILTAINHLPFSVETDKEKILERHREKQIIKRRLNDLCHESAIVREFVAENVRIFNGTKGDPSSFDLLDELLRDQAYRLAHWRVAADEINYRRFFDINDLAAIAMEHPEVFEKTHALILQLLDAGKINGLRIDHADGLYDPTSYLLKLQRTRFLQLCRHAARTLPEFADLGAPGEHRETAAAGAVSPESASTRWAELEQQLLAKFDALPDNKQELSPAQPLYVVAEKILEPGEPLPSTWPIHGTTGYDYLIDLNGLFVDRRNAKKFDSLYSQFVRMKVDFRDLVYRCKKLIMQVSMSSEINVLGHQLDRISENNRRSRDFTLTSLTNAIREIVACFPVYRSYSTSEGPLERDRRYIESAVECAKQRNPAISASIFEFVRDILLLRYPESADEEAIAAQQRFVGKFQQVTGPVMAKGLEDTAFYRYNRLVSLNEVGGAPEEFGETVAAFHRKNLDRRHHWPFAMLATATHDTKRGEDVRARINVLSEMPSEWKARAFRWSRWNQRKKIKRDGELLPSRNDEFLLYQTLIGTWPVEGWANANREEYIGRIEQYMLKAAHEAKVHTSWINPNEAYDNALVTFIREILADNPRNPFPEDVDRFAQTVTECGIWNSLSQTLIKLLSPGVPDLYQGTELWELSLVDPDNRRPVDFTRRHEILRSLRERLEVLGHEREELLRELLDNRRDGRIKMFVVSQLLDYRRHHRDMCTQGSYIPLTATGERSDHLCAFARQLNGASVIAIAPRLNWQLTFGEGTPPLGEAVWRDTQLQLPEELGDHFRNLLTGEILERTGIANASGLRLADVFRTFPVAALEVLGE